jgi:hypothetical protein
MWLDSTLMLEGVVDILLVQWNAMEIIDKIKSNWYI